MENLINETPIPDRFFWPLVWTAILNGCGFVAALAIGMVTGVAPLQTLAILFLAVTLFLGAFFTVVYTYVAIRDLWP